ncbi:HAD family hydrolase [Candidatus Sumerlaeota bacterium]|nr:HAD family hydrolase [Candidatus Sumerlaeota bacterium]
MTPPTKSPASKAEALVPCVFLDRDGTVTKEAGYVNHPDRIELIPGSAKAVAELNKAGVLAVVTTNQAGVARGYFTEAVLKLIHKRMEDLLRKEGAKLDAIYYCPHHRDSKFAHYRNDNGNRKPGIGMIHQACRAFPIDLRHSYVIGDKISDIEMARRAGVKGIFVLSGYGLGEFTYQRKDWKCQPDHVAEDLRAAVKWILKDLGKSGKR